MNPNKQEQIASLQKGIAAIAIGNPEDEKVRLIAVIFWHLARFFVLLSVEELKKIVPFRIALALQHKLPFNVILGPHNMDKIRTDGIVAEMFLDLYHHKVITATTEYSNVPEELRMSECDFAIISEVGPDEALAPWYIQGASNPELTRFVELLARGQIQHNSKLDHCVVIGATNHVSIENGKPVRIEKNKYTNGKFVLSDTISPTTNLLQIVRVRDID